MSPRPSSVMALTPESVKSRPSAAAISLNLPIASSLFSGINLKRVHRDYKAGIIFEA